MAMNRSCERCGCLERYKDGKCIFCTREYAKKRYHSDPEKHKTVARIWKQANRDRARISGRKGGRTDWLPGEHERAESALAITKECGVCGSFSARHVRGWNADHDHLTGLFRGIVCHPCNIAISHVEKFGLDRGLQISNYLKIHENQVS